MVSEELGRLNKQYPEQHYSVNQLSINETQSSPQPKMLLAREAAAQVPLAVSNELVMSAQVEAASNRRGESKVAAASH